jgi:hypothetical protein
MASKADQILSFVCQFSGRDDDEIARSLRIPQRQAVNAICRKLEAKGQTRRSIGTTGKIVNIPALQITKDVKPQSLVSAAIEPDLEGEAIPARVRPTLSADQLLQGGFRFAADWTLNVKGALQTNEPLQREKGVYAFVKAGIATYVGVATMGLKKRLYFYAKPGSTQRTSQRLNKILIAELRSGETVSIYTASPEDMIWNGLPVSGVAGLELGLIETFHLPWNIRSARQSTGKR